jgi:hypothetical protein
MDGLNEGILKIWVWNDLLASFIIIFIKIQCEESLNCQRKLEKIFKRHEPFICDFEKLHKVVEVNIEKSYFFLKIHEWRRI